MAQALISSRQNVSPGRLLEPGPSVEQLDPLLLLAAAPDHVGRSLSAPIRRGPFVTLQKRTAAVVVAEPGRYDRVAVALHWAIGAALLAQIAFGLLLDEIAPRGTPSRAAVINLHKSFGMVLGVLIVLRLAWRLAHWPPPWPASMRAGQRRAATHGHRLLYACMLVLPFAGYVGSNFSKHGIRFFGTTLAPWGPDWPAAYSFFSAVHVATAFLFFLLIVGHVAMALVHAIRRDGVFSRIVP